ncbi:uncharacterized protein FFB20_10037 [Fusarium fujikuroi]|nr:uncharacterized protein FFE2_03900 [Fusarium fujikuroi]SCN79927.1 uncharacterized protein FFM5_02234 [Fusarium fujikuroi]SCN95625.1 uncharacterized protein FFB20_10037 [Fusarium fujikuroi]SCN96081.1 uncharacterized protein FFC1_07483 [Fusarium fujikuroi]SCO39132.1 uncharacterized protein FFNC_06483 [Fusarium fujikuroi]
MAFEAIAWIPYNIVVSTSKKAVECFLQIRHPIKVLSFFPPMAQVLDYGYYSRKYEPSVTTNSY